MYCAASLLSPTPKVSPKASLKASSKRSCGRGGGCPPPSPNPLAATWAVQGGDLALARPRSQGPPPPSSRPARSHRRLELFPRSSSSLWSLPLPLVPLLRLLERLEFLLLALSQHPAPRWSPPRCLRRYPSRGSGGKSGGKGGNSGPPGASKGGNGGPPGASIAPACTLGSRLLGNANDPGKELGTLGREAARKEKPSSPTTGPGRPPTEGPRSVTETAWSGTGKV